MKIRRWIVVLTAVIAVIAMVVVFVLFSDGLYSGRDFVINLTPARVHTPRQAIFVASKRPIMISEATIKALVGADIGTAEQFGIEAAADRVIQENQREVVEVYVSNITEYENNQTSTGLSSNTVEMVNRLLNPLRQDTFFTVIVATETPGVFGVSETSTADHPRHVSIGEQARNRKVIKLYRLNPDGAWIGVQTESPSLFEVVDVSYVNPHHAAEPFYTN